MLTKTDKYAIIELHPLKGVQMTNEELAQHWNISLEEVKNISNIINYLYSVELIPEHEASDIWKVVLRANDGRRNYILMEEGRSFSDKKQAIICGTKWAQNIKMTPGQAKLMGVPEDAYLTLRPIDGYQEIKEKHFSSSAKKIHYHSSTKQRG